MNRPQQPLPRVASILLAVGFLPAYPCCIDLIDSKNLIVTSCSVYFPLSVVCWRLVRSDCALWGCSAARGQGILLVLCFHLFITALFHEDGLGG